MGGQTSGVGRRGKTVGRAPEEMAHKTLGGFFAMVRSKPKAGPGEDPEAGSFNFHRLSCGRHGKESPSSEREK